MRAAITQVGFDTLTDDNISQPFMNITHFSLAYVNGDERNRGLSSSYLIGMTKLVPDSNSGEVIHNVWQTPFYNTDYAGVGGSLAASLAQYYHYEYDQETDANVLYVEPEAIAFSGLNPAFDALCGGYTNTVLLRGVFGAENTGTEISSTSEFKDIVLPPFINFAEAASLGYSAYGDGNGPYLATDFLATTLMSSYTENSVYYATTPKLFPIRSWYPIDSSETDALAPSNVKTMNYEIALPGYAAKNALDADEIRMNSIGNFRFNRIGVYVTKAVQGASAPNTIKDFFPNQDGTEEPILFAVIELDQNVGGIAKGNSVLKTRSQESGTYEYSLDWQADLEFATSPSFINSAKFYQESYRSQATTQFMRQIEGNSVLAEAILQLQMQLLEMMFTNRVGTITALSDMVGNANPDPGNGPPSNSLLPTLYGPWTDANGSSWLSVFGRYKNGAVVNSEWKHALLSPQGAVQPQVKDLPTMGYQSDPSAYTLESLGAFVNSMASVFASTGLLKSA
jgi:hypothetical protein